jgi:hypothetical protein
MEVDLLDIFRNLQFFDLNCLLPALKKQNMSMAATRRYTQHLAGQRSDWISDSLNSWHKLSIFFNVWITCLTMNNIHIQIVGQILALQSLAINAKSIFPTDAQFVSIFYPYLERMLRERFEDAEGNPKRLNLTKIDQSYWPAEYFTQFHLLVQASQSKVTFEPASRAPVHHASFFDVDPYDEEHVFSVVERHTSHLSQNQSPPLQAAKTVALGSPSNQTRAICYAFQLHGGCPTSDCSFCARGGNRCLACGGSDHSAVRCPNDGKQLEYFTKVLIPDRENPKSFGIDPVYGSSPYELLNCGSVAEYRQKALHEPRFMEKIKATALSLQKEARRLEKGGKPIKETAYPAPRRKF